MINRELGLVEIYERIKAQRLALALKSFKRSPTIPLSELKNFPIVFMMEGLDQIVKPNNRGRIEYPAIRQLEVILEIIVNSSSTDIRQLYMDLRSVVLSDIVVVPDTSTVIKEDRAEGPFGYGMPDILGMRFVLALNYTDNG